MCGAASQWLVLSPRSQRVSCSPCFWVGFLLQSKDTLGKWNWDTQIACGFECVCLSVCVTPVIDGWHVHGASWLFTSSQWKTPFRKLIERGFVDPEGAAKKLTNCMFDVTDVTVSGRAALWVMQAQGFREEEDCVKYKKRNLLFCYIDFDPSILPGCSTFNVSAPLVTTF